MNGSVALRRLVQQTWRSGAVIAGQPTHATHPELLSEDEIWPGTSEGEFAARRERLASAMPAGTVAVLPAAQLQFMTGHIPYAFRQDSDFLYLTGINQQAVAVITASAPSSSFTLYIPEPSPQDEVWNGAGMSPEAASDVFGADEALPLSEMESHLGSVASMAEAVFVDRGDERGTRAYCEGALAAALAPAAREQRLRSLHPLLHAMRWRKSPSELGLMRRSAALAAQGLLRCMHASHPGVHEQRLAALFEYECRANGAQRMAYPSVVAGGADACTIHYLRNDKRVGPGELVLMDAGCELHGYASDVTRTWPAGGAFSRPQRALYELVLDTHRQCLEECRVGRTLRQVHARSVALLSEGLAELRVFPGLDAAAIARGPYRTLYPHSIGHWLGMDTHDTRGVTHDEPMAEGVVLTVEPGIYIPADPQRYGEYAGIGVRIEDDVAVTAGAPEVLSAGAPIAAADVERLAASCLTGTLR